MAFEVLNYYTVLGLPSPTSSHSASAAQIKVAFRRTLLQHHPDKAPGISARPTAQRDQRPSSAQFPYDIDTICLARDTLLDSARRQLYDNTLLQNIRTRTGTAITDLHPTELETLDLDDMSYNEERSSWSRVCRCGNSKAYEVTEEDLNIASEEGGKEVLVGCGGCSLFVRVVFEAIEVD